MITQTPYKYSVFDAAKVFHTILSGRHTHNTGKEIISLEREFSSYIGTRYAVATNSGTSSLYMALRAIGVGNRDEVLVPGYTFVAVAQAVLLCGGTPVFVDIDDTLALSPSAVRAAVSGRTKAIVVAHMFGNVADMDRIVRLAREMRLFVIEDCAQAVGATLHGKRVGSIGDIGCFSFNEKKAIPVGQGGMVTTSNKEFFRRLTAVRNTGIEMTRGRLDVTTVGSTFFMTEMQAVLARRALLRLDGLNRKRSISYALIQKYLHIHNAPVQFPRVVNGAEPSYSRFVCMVDFARARIQRESFIARVRESGVPIKTFYPTPLYMYSLFRKKIGTISWRTSSRSSRLPYTELFCKRQVAMEFSPYLSRSDVNNIGETILRNLSNV